MKNPMVLLSDVDQPMRDELKFNLNSSGFKILEVPGRENVRQLFSSDEPDLVITGLSEKLNGQKLKFVYEVRKNNTKIPIIMVASHSSEKNIIDAFRAGVNDFFKVPFSYKELLLSIKKNLLNFPERVNQRTSNSKLKNWENSNLIGSCRSLLDIFDYIDKVSKTDSTVLITGETGTGKELVAELIHNQSLRKNQPFISINSTAVPETLVESELFGYEKGAFTGASNLKKGKFEQAMFGTVFLDEIGDMCPITQAKLLRVIENKKIYRLGGKMPISLDFRLIAATNKDPEKLVKDDIFRNDLYYRLNVARIHLPPLRKRKEDLPLLIKHFVKLYNSSFGRNIAGFKDETLKILFRYDWPGNIRELKNIIEASFINLPPKNGQHINLPDYMMKQLKITATSRESERKRLVDALLKYNWNKSKVAKIFNCSRMTVYRKITKYNIIESRIRN